MKNYVKPELVEEVIELEDIIAGSPGEDGKPCDADLGDVEI